jgi:signal transduction histidine kinase/sensor domain CHASE-containing protein
VTLRRKTLFIVGATLVGLLVGFFVLTRLTLLRRFRQYEDRQAHQQLDRAYSELENEMAQLGTVVHDDAEWDEAYDFVKNPNPRFLQSNFPRAMFTELRIGVAEYLDSSNKVLFQQYSEAQKSSSVIPDEIQKELLKPGRFLGNIPPETVRTGIVLLPTGPAMIAACNVVKSSGEGPPVGTLIMGRHLDANEIHRLSLLTRIDLQIYRVDDPALPPDVKAAAHALSRLNRIVTRPVDSDYIVGYRLIDDVEDQPALVMTARMPRTIYNEGKATELYLMGAVLALGIAFSVLTLFLLERLVLSRLVGLGKNVETIGARGDLSARLHSEGHDELTRVSDLINRMLANLEKAEQERRRQEERYRAYINQSTEGIWRCEVNRPLPIAAPREQQLAHLHENLYLAECNDALARLHGFRSPMDMEGHPLREFFDATFPKNLELVHKFLEAGYSVADAESIKVDAQGHPRYFTNNISGMIENGQLVRIWGAQREVTEQRRLESQLRQAQKMEAMGRLAGGVAHDFNNLLSVIHGYTELIMKRFASASPGLKEAQHVLHATEKAASLTMQLLAFGRKQVLAPRILDLNAVIRDLDRILRRLIREDIEVVVQTDPRLWLVKADPAQMEQVIINLAVNARDALATGGTVTLETRNVELDESVSRHDPSLKAGSYVLLAVSDDGVGMDAETRANIFEPFFTTKPVGKGTGLGLSTVYGIVQQSGGQISVYSEPGRGSIFKIYLPRAEGKVEVATVAPHLEPVAAGTGTVLLVEDDNSVRRLAKEVLEGRGYKVIPAASGKEAIQMVNAESMRIDLLVTDVIMPGMAGDELVEHLRLMRPDLKVVFVSGYASDSIPRIATNARTAFLQKPFPVEDLVRTVHQMIAR